MADILKKAIDDLLEMLANARSANKATNQDEIYSRALDISVALYGQGSAQVANLAKTRDAVAAKYNRRDASNYYVTEALEGIITGWKHSVEAGVVNEVVQRGDLPGLERYLQTSGLPAEKAKELTAILEKTKDPATAREKAAEFIKDAAGAGVKFAAEQGIPLLMKGVLQYLGAGAP